MRRACGGLNVGGYCDVCGVRLLIAVMWGVHDVRVAAVNHCLGLDWDLGFGLVIWALLGQM